MDLYRIILVDDEEEVRKSIIKKIDWNSAGFCVVGDAENGEDALEKIEALEPDVILTDIRMPYMDGLTLAERVDEATAESPRSEQGTARPSQGGHLRL